MADLTFDIVSMTDFNEEAPNFFSANLSNRLFTAEIFPEHNMVSLCMGAVNVRSEEMDALRFMLSDEISLRGSDVQSDQNAISVALSVHDDWTDRMNRAIKCMEQWAKENGVFGGCFICGNRDHTVAVDNIGEIRTFMCSRCKESLRRERSNQQSQAAAVTSAAPSSGRFSRRKILLFSLLFSFVSSIILVLTLAYSALSSVSRDKKLLHKLSSICTPT